MALHCVPNILSTYIPKTKTIQPNYPNINHIYPLIKKKKKIPIGGFSVLMVVGGQYDRGGGPSDFSFSIFQMFYQFQVFYSETMCFNFVVKQCVLFNNPQHFCVSLSLSNALSGQLLLLILNYYFFAFFKILKWWVC